MVSISDLKRINLLKELPDHLLDIIASEAQLSIFSTNAELFRINEPVDTLYMLIMGQVALKVSLFPDVEVIIETVQSGSSFGLSSLVTGTMASATALCQEPCEVVTLPGEKMLKLFDDNPELGFHVMRSLAGQYRGLIERRSHMIMKTLDRYPEMKNKIDDLETLTPVY